MVEELLEQVELVIQEQLELLTLEVEEVEVLFNQILLIEQVVMAALESWSFNNHPL